FESGSPVMARFDIDRSRRWRGLGHWDLAVRDPSDNWGDPARSACGHGTGPSAGRARSVSPRTAQISAALPPVDSYETKTELATGCQLPGYFRSHRVWNCNRARLVSCPWWTRPGFDPGAELKARLQCRRPSRDQRSAVVKARDRHRIAPDV